MLVTLATGLFAAFFTWCAGAVTILPEPADFTPQPASRLLRQGKRVDGAARDHGDVLRAIDLVRHRTRLECAARVEVEQLLASCRMEGVEPPGFRSLEDKVARSGHAAARGGKGDGWKGPIPYVLP